MPIQLEPRGFYEWHEPLNPVPALGIATDRIDELVEYYHRKPFRGLFGHASFGFHGRDLEFLSQMQNAVYLWMWDVELDNVDGIYELTELEYAGINPKRPGIDFSRFPKLATAINHWIKKDHGLADSQIKKYHLWHYKPRNKSFDGLELPLNVEHLEFYWANPTNLAGLPRMESLKRMEFHRCRNLTDISALPAIAPNLEHFTVTTSKRVDPSAGILDHPTLLSAYINGEVIHSVE